VRISFHKASRRLMFGDATKLSAIAAPLIGAGITDGHPSIVRNPAAEVLCRHRVRGPPSLVGAGVCSHPPVASATGRSRLWRRADRAAGRPAGYSGPVARSLGRVRSSWPREPMASLAKTLCRWYWTVRALMNNRSCHRPRSELRALHRNHGPGSRPGSRPGTTRGRRAGEPSRLGGVTKPKRREALQKEVLNSSSSHPGRPRLRLQGAERPGGVQLHVHQPVPRHR